MKKKNNTEISVIHLAEFNLPAVTETANKDYIQFGTDNLYPQYLLELYNGSSINNAIIKGVSAMIYGEGLEATDREDSDEHKAQWLRLTSLLGHSQKDILKCLSFDLKLFGMCYVNAIWNKPRTKIVEMYHIPAQYIRSGKTDGYGSVNEYHYSADWSNPRKHKPRTYKAFDEKDRTNASQVLCIKDYSPGSYYYSLPDYQGSTSYIQLDMEIAQFHLSNIKSGMFPSMAVNFANGVPTREERKTIERQINSKFGGSGNAGKILITFNDGKDTAPEIVPINANDNADSYQFLSTETTRKVLTGHRVTSPLLFGVKGDGSGFGNNADELSDSFSLFLTTVIKPFQNTLLDGLQPLFAINDINLDLYFKTLKPADFINVESVSKISEDEQEKEGIDTGDEIKKEFTELSDDEFDSVLDNLNPEVIDEEWEVVEERDQGSEEDYEEWANRLIQKREDFADYIESKPSGFSYLDK
jgi:capsid portal protein